MVVVVVVEEVAVALVLALAEIVIVVVVAMAKVVGYICDEDDDDDGDDDGDNEIGIEDRYDDFGDVVCDDNSNGGLGIILYSGYFTSLAILRLSQDKPAVVGTT